MAWDVANYLDLKTIFINELIGSLTLFILISIVLIIYFCAKHNIPNTVTAIFIIIFAGVIFTAYGVNILWLIAVGGATLAATYFYIRTFKA